MPQVVGEVFGRRVAVGRPLGECLEADALQFLRNAVVDLPWRSGIQRRDLFQQFLLCFALEGAADDQQFVKHDAQREDIAAPVDAVAFATSLLGAHVGRCPDVLRSLADVLFP